MYQLYVGNKNYSSWSLRPWVLMRELGIPFEEHVVPLDPGTSWTKFRAFSPTGLTARRSRAAVATRASGRPMRVPSYLKRNRHGVYCLRVVASRLSTQHERRFPELCVSLRTRDPRDAVKKSRLLTARLITVLPQLRSAAFLGDDEATVMITNVKRWLKSLIGAAGALEAPLQMEGGVHTAVPAANDGRLPLEAVGAVVAEVMKALGSPTAALDGAGRSAPGPIPSPATPLLPGVDCDESVARWIQLHAGTWTPKTEFIWMDPSATHRQ